MSLSITTSDNPYNPLTQFDDWNEWDVRAGYNTTNLLARLHFTAPSLSPEEDDMLLEFAIDTMIDEIPTGSDAIYLKVDENYSPSGA